MADWYCDYTSGNDSSGSGTSSFPYQTVQKCIDSAARGDTIHIANTSAQVLSGNLSWSSFNTSGSGKTVFQPWDNYGSLSLTIPGTGAITSATIDASGLSTNWIGSVPNHVVLKDLKIDNSSRFDGINSVNTVGFFRCHFIPNRTNGYHIQSGLVVVGCTFENLGVQGTSTIVGNLFKNCSAYAIYSGSDRQVVNNVFLGNTTYTGSNPIVDVGNNSLISGNVFISRSARTGTAIRSGNNQRVLNNVFQGFNGLGGSGIDANSNTSYHAGNIYYDCTSNTINDADVFFATANVTASSAPYADAGTDQWEASSEVASKAYPTGFSGVNTQTYRDAGAIEHVSSSGSSSSSSGSKWTTITDLTGLVAWYKPETLASTYSNGDSITTWADSSGNSRDLTGSGTTRPLAAANAFGTYMAADFDGTDDILSTASYQQSPNPVYSIVFEIDVLKNFNGPITIMNQNPPAWFTGVGNLSWFTTLIHSNGKIQINRFKDSSNSYTNSLDGSASATTKYVMTIAYTEIAWDLRLNGSDVSGGATTGTPSFSFPSLDTAYIHLGHGGHSSSPFNGKIVEAVVYDAVDIDNANSIWVEGYLADKYGITLADGHLFKNAAPQNSPTTYNATSSGGSSYTNVAAAKFTRLE